MFKKFSVRDDLSSQAQAKSSSVRGVRTRAAAQMPALAAHVDDIVPRKAPLMCARGPERTTFYSAGSPAVPLLVELDGGTLVPTLRLLHKYPDALPHVQVDRGAVPHVLRGADIMCPGLTSAGGRLPQEPLPADAAVAVMAEGKTHAVAVGLLKMSTDEIKSANKGIGIINVHYLNDGLWKSLQ